MSCTVQMDHVSLNKYICRTNSDREKYNRSVQQHVSYKGQLVPVMMTQYYMYLKLCK